MNCLKRKNRLCYSIIIFVIFFLNESHCGKIPIADDISTQDNAGRDIRQKLNKIDVKVDDIEDELNKTKINVYDNKLNIRKLLDVHEIDYFRDLTSKHINGGEFEQAKNLTLLLFTNSTEIERIVNTVFNNNSYTRHDNFMSVLHFTELLHPSFVGHEKVSLSLFFLDSLNTKGRLSKSHYIEFKIYLLKSAKKILECVECACYVKSVALKYIRNFENDVKNFAQRQLINGDVQRKVENGWFSRIYHEDQKLARNVVKESIQTLDSNDALNLTLRNFNNSDTKVELALSLIYIFEEMEKTGDSQKDIVFKFGFALKNAIEINNKATIDTEINVLGTHEWDNLKRELRMIIYRIPTCPRNVVFAKNYIIDRAPEIPISRFVRTKKYVENENYFEIQNLINGILSFKIWMEDGKCYYKFHDNLDSEAKAFSEFSKYYEIEI